MSEWYNAHRAVTAFGHPDTCAYPWQVTLKNRYSRTLVRVDYFDDEKAARAYARDMRYIDAGSRTLGDYTVKVTNLRKAA